MRDGPYKQILMREVLPDPKLITEKYKLVENAHRNSDTTKLDIMDSINKVAQQNPTIRTNIQPSIKNIIKKSSSKKSPLQLPWITVVTATGILIAVALIYTL